MTLKELLTGALLQLDRGADAQTMELWRDKLTRFVNDGVLDLSNAVRTRRTDPVQIAGRTADTGTLPRECVKVLSLMQDGVRLPFYYGVGNGLLHVPCGKDGEARITYRYVPRTLKADTDEPELPACCHGALIAYAVGRERAGGDAASLAAARACFEVYHSMRSAMAKSQGELDGYRIENAY